MEYTKEWLESHGFDGLYCPGECACVNDDLFPCGMDIEEIDGECLPGYEMSAPKESGFDFMIGPEKLDPRLAAVDALVEAAKGLLDVVDVSVGEMVQLQQRANRDRCLDLEPFKLGWETNTAAETLKQALAAYEAAKEVNGG